MDFIHHKIHNRLTSSREVPPDREFGQARLTGKSGRQKYDYKPTTAPFEAGNLIMR